jgi:hypothetical protein
LPESIFCDALYEKEKLFSVIAPLLNRSCAIAAYNLAIDHEAKLTGKISPEDYRYSPAMMQPFNGFWEIPREGLVIYDWKEQTASKLHHTGIEFKIDGFGHRLFLLCPVNNGWAVIGRTDKYLSPSTVEILESNKDSITIQIYEPGSIILYSEKGAPDTEQMDFVSLGNSFYKGKIKGIALRHNMITITR